MNPILSTKKTVNVSWQKQLTLTVSIQSKKKAIAVNVNWRKFTQKKAEIHH